MSIQGVKCLYKNTLMRSLVKKFLFGEMSLQKFKACSVYSKRYLYFIPYGVVLFSFSKLS